MLCVGGYCYLMISPSICDSCVCERERERELNQEDMIHFSSQNDSDVHGTCQGHTLT